MSKLKKDTMVTLVPDQDVTLAESRQLMTVTLFSPIEGSIRRVTDVCASVDACLKSPYLKSIAEVAKDPANITLEHGLTSDAGGVNTQSALVWLAHLHGLSVKCMTELGLTNVEPVAVWEVLQIWIVQEKRGDIQDLKPWFDAWYDTAVAGKALTHYVAGLLAFPCQAFDHAVGFANVTKFLVYNTVGGIKDRKPKDIKLKTFHLAPNEFIGPLNHARGGLKTALHKSIWKRANNVLRFDTGKCNCWDATIGQYLAALVKIDVFPIEDAMSRSSFQGILERMKNFRFEHRPACNRCRSIDFAYVVQMTRQFTQSYFDGLCLDCMDRSKPKGKDLDDEYWRINSNVNKRWDSRCRVHHGQPTWYVSWLGRDDTRQKLLKGAHGYHDDDEEEDE